MSSSDSVPKSKVMFELSAKRREATAAALRSACGVRGVGPMPTMARTRLGLVGSTTRVKVSASPVIPSGALRDASVLDEYEPESEIFFLETDAPTTTTDPEEGLFTSTQEGLFTNSDYVVDEQKCLSHAWTEKTWRKRRM